MTDLDLFTWRDQEDNHEAQANEVEFKRKALGAIERICRRQSYLTTDDVWVELRYEKPPEPRALGACMRIAQRRGYCRPTDRTAKSRQGTNNGRPVRVWMSTISAAKDGRQGAA